MTALVGASMMRAPQKGGVATGTSAVRRRRRSWTAPTSTGWKARVSAWPKVRLVLRALPERLDWMTAR